MIEYRLFTKPELLRWRTDRGLEGQNNDDAEQDPRESNAPRIGVQDEPSHQLSMQYPHEVDDNAVCGICAFDDDRLIGRISILYFDLMVHGRRRRCCVGSNFMVLKEYRNSAVGLSILLKAMNLGMPYFEASVSGPMRGILEKMKQFHHIDSSPIFQLGVDRSGIVQIATWDFYKNPSSANILSEQAAKLRALTGNWLSSRRVTRSGSAGYKVIKPDDALQILEADFKVPRFPIQVPWNKDLLVK